MNADRLFALYDRVAEAPDAIGRLRRFVLDLALRGKLVEQDPADEPALGLLNRIDEANDPLAGFNRAKKSRALPPINPREVPFELPSAWQWVYFGNIVDFSAGRTPPRKEPSYWNTGDFPWISIADMEDGKTLRSTKETVSTEARLNVFKREPEPPGTMIMSFKLTIGKIAKLGISAFHNEAIISIRPHVGDLNSYLFKVLPDLARGANTKGAIKGATLNRKSLLTIMVPLPPLAEQCRIVAKVDELLAVCDQLEKARTAREDTRDRLTKASLTRLVAPDIDAPTFRSHARFAVDALPALTARADQIRHLRQTILGLAVRGKLVEQNPADEPADEILERIAAEKVRLLRARKIRRHKSTASLSRIESDFGLPSGWAAARFSDVVTELRTGPFGSSLHRSDYEKGGTPVINPASIQDGKIVPFENMAIGDDTLERLATFKLRAGDIVMGRRGEMGRCAVVEQSEEGWLCGTGSLILRLSNSLYPKYLAMLIGSPNFRENLRGHSVGATMQNLNQSILLKMSIGLPPLAEQYRIVAKVDEFLALCDRLEARITTTDGTRHRLLGALLHNVLASNTKPRPLGG